MNPIPSQQEPALDLAPSSVPFRLPPLQPAPGKSYWPAAILVSLVLHGLLGWWGVFSPRAPAPAKEKTRVTRISFQREQPPPPAAKPLPQTAPATPKPAVKPPPAPRPEPISEAQPVIEAEPAAATARPAAQITPEPPPAAASPPEHLRQDYLARIMAHLEEHKFYPGAARRRGLEGTVQVSFTITAAGEIRQLELAGGHKMLHQAATETMRNALPLPPPPRELNAPLAVSYGMTFALR